MKRLLLVLFGKWAKTHEKEIAKSQKWIDSAQGLFASAVEEAMMAEEGFRKIEISKRQQAEKAIAELNEASAKKEQAIKFKNKVQQFIEE